MKTSRFRIPILAVGFALLAASACETLQKGVGAIDAQSAKVQSVVKVAKQVRSTFADITEEEEYYIGRAVAATILSYYNVYNNEGLNRYVNAVGTAVAAYSDRPETYAGYHFLVLDSDEVNALAAPSGFIFLTRGLLKRCKDEDTLADILAHEIGHVCAKHGLQSIKKSRLIDAFRLLGEQAAQKYGPQELSQLTGIFEDVLGDIAEKLIERGYDRKYEYEADDLAAEFAARMRYDGKGLVDFLETMVQSAAGGADKGWFKTHPSPQDRIDRVKGQVKTFRRENARTDRFRAAFKGLK
jgi:predicted Zn-dependent protease